MHSQRFLSVLIFFSIAVQITAQTLDWNQSYGGSGYDTIRSLQITSDGGFIMTGSSNSDNGDITNSHGGFDYWVVKTSSDGSIEWEKSFGGSESDGARYIIQTADGGYAIAGYAISDDGDVTGHTGGTDLWIVKTSSNGTLEWQETYGGNLADDAQGLQQTADGGYIVVGYSQGDIDGFHGGYDAWVLKLTSTGGVEWQKTLGGSNFEFGRAIKQTTDGGYIMTGSSESTDGDTSHNNGQNDFWIVKLSNTGTLEWQQSLGGSDYEDSNDIVQTNDGGYMVVGTSGSNDGDVTENSGGRDYWVVKLNNAGNLDWQKSFGGSGNDYGESVQQTSDNGFIIAGRSNSTDGDISNPIGDYDFWILKLSNNGTLEWETSLGGSLIDAPNVILETDDNEFIIGGESHSNDGDVSTNNGSSDYWVAKLLGPNLSLNETSTSFTLELFPNPTGHYLHLKSEVPIEYIEVYNQLSQLVLTKTYNAHIDVSKLSTGLYFLKVYGSNNTYKILQFIKE